MKDKIVKENDNFIWYETQYGVGYVVPKRTYFHFSDNPNKLEIIADDPKDQETAKQMSELLNHYRKSENELSD